MAATRRIMDNDERCVLVDFLAHNLLAGDLIPGWPMNRGGLGARSLNIELQKALNPPGEIHIEHFGSTFCAGGKVMQIENDYDQDVYNGDLGVVSRIDTEGGELVADFNGREVTYAFGELDELVLAYATTIPRAKARNTRPC